MKKLVLLIAAFAIFSCKNEPEAPKDYVTLSGKIENKNSDSLVVANREFSKTIKVNEDGTFKDTLKVKPGVYSVYDGKEVTSVYLKNDFDINLTLNAESFYKTVQFTGNGAVHSNFLAESRRKSEEMLDIDTLSSLDSLAFVTRMDEIKNEFTSFFNSQKEVDSTLISNSLKDIEPMMNFYKGYISEVSAIKRKFPKGTPSPTFDYENHKGGKTSLTDLKGKYAYIDVWATWCGPCISEIPSLKKVEQQYHDKNIEFISISIDEPKAYDKWKEMVTAKELGGIQLIADNAWGSDFVKDYKITGIPRFILIDPDGNVIDANAPRPSDPKLIKMLDDLKI